MIRENKLVSHCKGFIKMHIIMVGIVWIQVSTNTWSEQMTVAHSLFIFIILINIMNTHNVSYGCIYGSSWSIKTQN